MSAGQPNNQPAVDLEAWRRWIADEIHREARWISEQRRRNLKYDPVERLLILEELARYGGRQ